MSRHAEHEWQLQAKEEPAITKAAVPPCALSQRAKFALWRARVGRRIHATLDAWMPTLVLAVIATAGLLVMYFHLGG